MGATGPIDDEGLLPGGLLGDGEDGRDRRTLLAGTAQNLVGLVVYVLGTFGANVLVARAFGGGAAGAVVLGLVTLATQFAFVAAAGTRFGMDMAAVREVAIEAGKGGGGRIRGIVDRALAVALLASLAVALPVVAAAPWIAARLSDQPEAAASIRWAAVALPFVAVTFVSLGASRGLKIMRHTLLVQWIGQPLLWIALMPLAWRVERSATAAVAAYAASWVVTAGGARLLWAREARAFGREPAAPGELGRLVRYGAPRAPAALLSQGLFWVDYFVASAFVARGDVAADALGVYSSSVRVALAVVLFLTAVSYVFSPFVADLHARGERERLEGLFRSITRWTVAGTIPVLLLMLVVPGPLLRVFGGSEFAGGADALRILLVGQAVNVGVGAAGFVLIMAGHIGWDLVVYALSFVLDLALAVALVPRFGVEGAAIAQSVTVAASNALRLWLVHRFVGIQPYDRSYLRLLPATAGATLAMVATHAMLADGAWPVDLAVTGLAGLAVYAPLLVATGLLPAERRAALRALGRSG
ncbi:MAG: polysaccharide biosynthesis C-terminal domain-containing protein [Actinomycetota bacterium]